MIEKRLEQKKITCCKLSFANLLKDEVAKATGVDRSTVDLNKELYRPLLQGWGQWRRNGYKDYFVTKLLNQILKEEAKVITIDDVRFVNEVEVLKDMKAKIIRLERNIIIKEMNKDISETELDNYPFEIKYYNKTIEGLDDFSGLVIESLSL